MQRLRAKGFSMVELLVVIAIIGILASLLLTALSASQARSRQTACIGNLHQIGLGFIGFAVDHDGKYPMDVPERLGGSLEYNQQLMITNTGLSRACQHFIALSNEVPNAKVMACPADRRRHPVSGFRSFTNANLSYWANPAAPPHASLMMLAGDWNVWTDGPTNSMETLRFGREVHQRKGSVLFADGRVEITRTLAYQPPPGPQTEVVSVPQTGGPRPTTTPAAPPPAPPPLQSPQNNNGGSVGSDSNPTPQRQIAPDQAALDTGTGRTNGPGKRTVLTRAVYPSPPSASVPSRPPRAEGAAETTPTNAPSILSIHSPSISPPEPDEPWDSSGFRAFKYLAFASYLISLLWALIALLVLYLRSRRARASKPGEPQLSE